MASLKLPNSNKTDKVLQETITLIPWDFIQIFFIDLFDLTISEKNIDEERMKMNIT
jgi:hypothetical protein